ncbi:hypothetical protein Ae201684P_004945 [Aphanomyces euteiches]|nr:hypothetical protein Ae201684P_004945 [Aphanomyces euteiches]
MPNLFCVVVGEASPFPVDVAETETVGDLKDKIKGKKSNTIQCDADKLQLYLALKDGEGLRSSDAERVKLGDLEGFTKMDPLLRIKNKKHFGENFQPNEGEIYVLVVVPDESQAKRKLHNDVEGSHEQIKRKKYQHSKVGTTVGPKILRELKIDVVPVTTKPFATNNSTPIDPFLWESVKIDSGQQILLTEEQQRQNYLSYVRCHIGRVLTDKGLCVIGVEKKKSILNVEIPHHDIDLVGCTDLLVLGQVVQEDSSNLQYLPDVKLLIEVKRSIEDSSDFQALSELIALDLIVTNDPVMALLTDLNNTWRFFWVADMINGTKIIHKMTITEPGKAFYLIRKLLRQSSDQDIGLPFCEIPLKRRKLAVMFDEEGGNSGGICESIEQFNTISNSQQVNDSTDCPLDSFDFIACVAGLRYTTPMHHIDLPAPPM